MKPTTTLSEVLAAALAMWIAAAKRRFVYAVGSKVVFDRSTSIYPDR